MGTVLSILIAGLILLYPGLFQGASGFATPLVLAVALIFLLLYALLVPLMVRPLQRVEFSLTPKVVSLFQSDRPLLGVWLVALVFIFSSVGLALSGLFAGARVAPLAVWMVGFGVVTDLYRYGIRRAIGFLDPFQVVARLRAAGERAIAGEDGGALCDAIDAISEVGLKAIVVQAIALAQNAIDELQKVTTLFLADSKSIASGQEAIGSGKQDKIGFTLYYVFQRIEMLFKRAFEQALEPVVAMLISSSGKIALQAGLLDMSLLAFPVFYIGRFALQAQEKWGGDSGETGIRTLLHVSEVLIEKADLTYQELQESYFALISQIEMIVKCQFRQDKTIGFDRLNAPLVALRKQFENVKVANHPDTKVIVADINRVLDEFINLEMVLKKSAKTKV